MGIFAISGLVSDDSSTVLCSHIQLSMHKLKTSTSFFLFETFRN